MLKALIVILAIVFGSLLLMWFTVPAHAMGMCGTRDDFIRALNDKYSEGPKAMALAGQVNIVEVFTSKVGTWTIIVTTPEGRTCIIAAGSGWADLPPFIEGKDS